MRRIPGIVAAALLPQVAVAQTIRGTVVDSDSVPVSGVIVVLIDAVGGVSARALTSDAGEFRLTADRSGAYRLRTLRLGFRPMVSEPIALESGQDVTRRVVLSGVPLSLDTVRVVGQSLCRLNADSASVTYALWEQVRGALTAAQVTSRARALGATLAVFDRVTDPAGKRVKQEERTIKSGFATKAWYSLPADSLRRVGYVVDGPDGVRTYYAPDFEVLLSDIFLEDHCFRIAASDDPSAVAISFVPARHRSEIAEIAGTVWLDRRSAMLRGLAFAYVNLRDDTQRGRPGGDMDFVRMRNSAWAISRWNIRMPVLVQRGTEPSGIPGMPSRPMRYVAEVKVTGGELLVVTRGKDTLFASGTPREPALAVASVVAPVALTPATTAPSSRATLTGRILRATDRIPIAGADITVGDGGPSARSDSKGNYRLAEIPAGIRDVTAQMVGFGVETARLSFRDDSLVNHDFLLTAARQLDSVVVAARRPSIPEFEERRKIGIGHFLTRDDLEKNANHRMSEVLARVGGLRVERATGGTQAWISAGRGQITTYAPDPYSKAMGAKPACFVDVWLDGVRVYAGQDGQPLFDVNSLQPASLEAVEYYAGASQIPSRFIRVNQDCGVLVLWTRRGG